MAATDGRSAIFDETKEIERKAGLLENPTTSRLGIGVWIHHGVGSLAAVLAALAGVSVVAQWSEDLAAILAVLAAGVSALTAFMDPKPAQDERRKAAARYADLCNQAKLLWNVHSKFDDDEALRQRLEKLFERKRELDEDAPPVLGPIRWLAERRARAETKTSG